MLGGCVEKGRGSALCVCRERRKGSVYCVWRKGRNTIVMCVAEGRIKQERKERETV